MLSVLVPTMPDRRHLLSRLLFGLTRQPGIDDTFEVIVYQGEAKTGDKINTMIEYAAGSHVVVVDDDDWVSDRYVETLLPHLDVDAVGFDIAMLSAGRFARIIRHDPSVQSWEGGLRGFCHKVPVRRKLAAAMPFGNAYTDDIEWAKAVASLIKSSVYVPRVLYFYDFMGNSEVGPWPYDPTLVRWL